MLSVASKQLFPWSVLPRRPSHLSIGEFVSGTPSSIRKLARWKLHVFAPRCVAHKVQEHLPCMRSIARDRAYRASAEIKRALALKAWEHNQTQHKERDTSTGHILGRVVNGCTSCHLCGRQNGVGNLLEFVMRKCASRDQELQYEVVCWIPREPHPGGPRDKWQQRSLKSFSVPSFDTLSDDVVDNPAVPCEVFIL